MVDANLGLDVKEGCSVFGMGHSRDIERFLEYWRRRIVSK